MPISNVVLFSFELNININHAGFNFAREIDYLLLKLTSQSKIYNSASSNLVHSLQTNKS